MKDLKEPSIFHIFTHRLFNVVNDDFTFCKAYRGNTYQNKKEVLISNEFKKDSSFSAFLQDLSLSSISIKKAIIQMSGIDTHYLVFPRINDFSIIDINIDDKQKLMIGIDTIFSDRIECIWYQKTIDDLASKENAIIDFNNWVKGSNTINGKVFNSPKQYEAIKLEFRFFKEKINTSPNIEIIYSSN